jgi:deoxyribodipyrimidine photo-lyase
VKDRLVVYWSRRDFRLHDNPALHKAIEESVAQQVPLLPLFVLEDYMCAGDPTSQFGYPSRYVLSHALPAFAKRFPEFAIVRGKAARTIVSIAAHYDIVVYVNEDVHPDFYAQVKKLLAAGVGIHVLKDQMTIDRHTKTGSKAVYSVFTPFKRAVWAQFIETAEVPVSVPAHAMPPTREILETVGDRVVADATTLMSLFSTSRKITAGDMRIDLSALALAPNLSGWYFDEDTALSRFDEYLALGGVAHYQDRRDSLELDVHAHGATSRMSLALAWGLVSARTLKSKIRTAFARDLSRLDTLGADTGALTYLSELIWREFYKYLFYHDPHLLDREFQTKFRGSIPWVSHDGALERFTAWITGETGYPLVDAAMKQLAQTGWMHNRARMVVASVLTKNLGVDWRWGQEYFRAALVDLDEASNNGGWQWGASVGADPKPIRIFNPELQAKMHDPSGAYQKKWLGDERYMHPIAPLVPHPVARQEALVRYGIGKGKKE